jgi:DNA-binding CsgD family transcriptional regulator
VLADSPAQLEHTRVLVDLGAAPHALTAAEHRVARLAAEGHSDREIAEQLYVTQRTVETHLTHVFAKLDIHARAELAVALTRTDSGVAEPAPA